MAKQGSLQVGDRVIIHGDVKYAGMFGRIEGDYGDSTYILVLEGENDSEDGRAIYQSVNLTKVSPNAGKPKLGRTGMSSTDRVYALGAYALVTLRENPDPQEFTAQMYNAATEWKLL